MLKWKLYPNCYTDIQLLFAEEQNEVYVRNQNDHLRWRLYRTCCNASGKVLRNNLDRWMDGWMDGWVDGWMDGGGVDGWMNGWMGG